MSTKAQQILNPWSVWNQTPNDEPVFIIKADDWRLVMLLATLVGRMSTNELIDQALAMKQYHDENDIPF